MLLAGDIADSFTGKPRVGYSMPSVTDIPQVPPMAACQFGDTYKELAEDFFGDMVIQHGWIAPSVLMFLTVLFNIARDWFLKKAKCNCASSDKVFLALQTESDSMYLQALVIHTDCRLARSHKQCVADMLKGYELLAES